LSTWSTSRSSVAPASTIEFCAILENYFLVELVDERPSVTIVITGSNGTIGNVLVQALSRTRKIVEVDLPEHDASDFLTLRQLTQDSTCIVHLAHDSTENWQSGVVSPTNTRMFLNVLQAAVENLIPRVIIASSVHASDFLGATDTNPPVEAIHSEVTRPTSPYGAHKFVMEQVAKFYAQRFGMEAVAIRFGGVSADNSVRTNGREPAVWLSHDDLISAVLSTLEAPVTAGRFSTFNAVSNNADRVHDLSNPFGWSPLDDSNAR
jgi:uronate dehydrogenase